MKIQHINPMGGGQVAALGMKHVDRGEVVDVGEDVAALLLIQTANWTLPDKAPKADAEFVAKVIGEHLAELAAASRPAVDASPDTAAPPAADDTTGEGEPA